MSNSKKKNSLDDIDLKTIDLKKHTLVLKPGEILYRVIIGPYNPVIPTGQENRCAKNPHNATPDEYIRELFSGNGAHCSTGSTISCNILHVAYNEVLKHNPPEKIETWVAHKIKVLKDIPVINTISICLSSGVDPTPGGDHPFWHSFYGPPIRAQAIKFKSSVDPSGENTVFFPDNIPDYFDSISSVQCSREEIDKALKTLTDKFPFLKKLS